MQQSCFFSIMVSIFMERQTDRFSSLDVEYILIYIVQMIYIYLVVSLYMWDIILLPSSQGACVN